MVWENHHTDSSAQSSPRPKGKQALVSAEGTAPSLPPCSFPGGTAPALAVPVVLVCMLISSRLTHPFATGRMRLGGQSFCLQLANRGLSAWQF